MRWQSSWSNKSWMGRRTWKPVSIWILTSANKRRIWFASCWKKNLRSDFQQSRRFNMNGFRWVYLRSKAIWNKQCNSSIRGANLRKISQMSTQSGNVLQWLRLLTRFCGLESTEHHHMTVCNVLSLTLIIAMSWINLNKTTHFRGIKNNFDLIENGQTLRTNRDPSFSAQRNLLKSKLVVWLRIRRQK